MLTDDLEIRCGRRGMERMERANWSRAMIFSSEKGPLVDLAGEIDTGHGLNGRSESEIEAGRAGCVRRSMDCRRMSEHDERVRIQNVR